jgi:hypothetical protein
MSSETGNQPRPTEEPWKEAKAKERRFRIVKLEERIAPGGGNTRNHKCGSGYVSFCGACASIQ